MIVYLLLRTVKYEGTKVINIYKDKINAHKRLIIEETKLLKEEDNDVSFTVEEWETEDD